MKKSALVSLAALLAFASTAWSEPTVTVKSETYEIYGMTAHELREQMVLFGVTWRDGKKYDALTTWVSRWRYTWDSGVNSCEITGVQSSVEVLYRLPKWANEEEAAPVLRNRWKQYMANLMVHENGHKDLGIDAAAEMEKAIMAMPPQRTSKALETAANTLGEEILHKYRALEVDYDQKTDHGRTQGAVFP